MSVSEEVLERGVTTVTVTSTVQVNVSLDELRLFFKQRRITGELRIVLNDGGIRQITLTERKVVDIDITKM